MSHLHTRARLAAVARHAPGSEAETEARRDHAAALIEQRIREIVDAAPPLPADQYARLRALLTPSAPVADAHERADAGPVAA